MKNPAVNFLCGLMGKLGKTFLIIGNTLKYAVGVRSIRKIFVNACSNPFSLTFKEFSIKASYLKYLGIKLFMYSLIC